MTIPPDGGLLIYTDGLPDSIPGHSPEDSLVRALRQRSGPHDVQPQGAGGSPFNEDDVTVLPGEANA